MGERRGERASRIEEKADEQTDAKQKDENIMERLRLVFRGVRLSVG